MEPSGKAEERGFLAKGQQLHTWPSTLSWGEDSSPRYYSPGFQTE